MKTLIGRPATRELAAIVFADFVDFSAIMSRDERRALKILKAARTVFDPLVAAYRGAIVKEMGDGLLMKFASLVEAVACAIAIQKGLAGADFGGIERPRFRFGVTFGDIVVENADVFGDGVNLAARLEKLAAPGGLCLSANAHAEIRNRLAARFVSGGARELKGIDGAVEVFLLSPEDLAQAEAPPPAGDRRRAKALIFTGGIAVALLLAFGGGRWLLGASETPLPQRLQALLASALPDETPHARNKLVRDYLDLEGHRAISFAPRSRQRWWTGDWASRAEAEEKALERCQLAYAEPCAIIAADDLVLEPGADRRWPTREMPRLTYDGLIDAERIPGVRTTKGRHSDLANYLSAPAPKAVAIQARGVLYFVTGADSQAAAEENALKRCNDDPLRKDVNGPCYLYASGTQVVLPRRLTAPSRAN